MQVRLLYLILRNAFNRSWILIWLDSIKSPQNKGKESQFGDSASIPDGLLALNSTSTLAAPHIFVSAGVVRSVPNNSDSSGLRPIFRKGFPAKKSLKAEVRTNKN